MTSTRVRTHKPGEIEVLNLPEGHAEQMIPSTEIELLGQSVHAPLPVYAYLDTKVFDVVSFSN